MKRYIRRIFRKEPESWHVSFITNLSKIIKPDNYAELGIYEGETFLKVCASHKFGVDIMEHALNFIPNQNNITKICGTSKDLANVLSLGSIKLDLLFIDANHECDEVIKDFTVLLPHLSDRCIVLFHDTFPKDILFSEKKYCGDAYRALPILSERYKLWSFITIPIHPGISIGSRNPLYPEWVKDTL